MATVQIEQERKNGNFTDVFDFAERLGTKFSNKKVVEGLAKAGGFFKTSPKHKRNSAKYSKHFKLCRKRKKR